MPGALGSRTSPFMKPFCILWCCALWLMVLVPETAHAQWVLTGTTAGGSSIVTGSNTLGGLGPGAPLSVNGGDTVTASSNAVAESSSGDTIQFVTSNDTLVNNGSISGTSGQPSAVDVSSTTDQSYPFNAVTFNGISDFSGESITNNGTIAGGNGSAPGVTGSNGSDGSWALDLTGSSLGDIEITNNGAMTGGFGGLSGTSAAYGGTGGDSIHLTGTASISDLFVVNSGIITGGTGEGGNDSDGGTGINVSGSAVENVGITVSGTLSGGEGGSGNAGGNGGYAVDLTGSSLGDIAITNSNGIITGGVGGLSGTNGISGGTGGDSIHLTGSASISGLSVISSGIITGGTGEGGDDSGGGAGINLSGSSMEAVGITVSGTLGGGGGGSGTDQGGNGGFAVGLSGSEATDVSISNDGGINGGSGGNYTGANTIGNYGAGGDGVGLYENTMTGVTIFNDGAIGGGNVVAPGAALGGNGINLEVDSLGNLSAINTGTMGGGSVGGSGFVFNGAALSTGTITNTGVMSGGTGGAALMISATESIANLSITNDGAASGGNGTSYNSFISGGAGQDGISVSGSMLSALVVSGTGTMTGGKGGVGIGQPGGPGGTGLALSGSLVSNLTVTNGGSATGGAGATGSNSFGAGGAGISFYGSSSISGVQLSNIGNATGGAGATGTSSFGNGGPGISFSTEPGASISAAAIDNSGAITGGTGAESGASSGDGLDLTSSGSGVIAVNNYGAITGGTAAAGVVPGIGINGNENGAVLNNFGAITSGSGANGVAVSFSGSNNTLNVIGQFTVNGLIQSTGTNNVLNFSPTGLSTSAAAALQTALATYLTGQPTTGSVTILGGTCAWNAMIIEYNAAVTNVPPTSSVEALPAYSASQVWVRWSGAAYGGGSVASYSIYVSSNGGATWTPWLVNTTQTSAIFQGNPGTTYSFYSIATDPQGNVEESKVTADTSTHAISASSFLGALIIAKNDPVPGVANGKFLLADNPAVDANGDVAFKAFITGTSSNVGIGRANNEGIWFYSGSNGTLLARTGSNAVGTSGASYSILNDPVLDSTGSLAFGASLTGGDVLRNQSNAAGVWVVEGGTTTLALRAGGAAAGQAGENYAKFNQIVTEQPGDVAFLGTLTGAGVTPASALGLWGVDLSGTTDSIIRTGASITAGAATRTVKSLNVFPSLTGVRGQSRSVDTVAGNLALGLGFTDKSQAIAIAVPQTSGFDLEDVVGTYDSGVPGIADARWVSLGAPAVNANSTVAFRATVSGTTPAAKITASNNAGVWLDVGANLALVARTGTSAPGVTDGAFATLTDPVLNNNDQIAFIGTMRPVRDQVTPATAAGIWATTSGTLNLVVRAGTTVPGPTGGKFAAFQQVVFPDTGGPIFQATLTGASAGAKSGVWSVDSAGTLHLVALTGEFVNVHGINKTITSFSLFTVSPQVAGQSRNFDAPTRSVAFLANFSDGTWAILQTIAL